MDTVQRINQSISTVSAICYKRAKKYPERLEWVQKSLCASAEPTNRDMYDFGEAAYIAGNYKLADSVFTII